MKKRKIKEFKYNCIYCGFIGQDIIIPKYCPKCKSPYWNTPRKSEKK